MYVSLSACTLLLSYMYVSLSVLSNCHTCMYVSISYGIGMIVGPTIGGKLSTIYSEQFAAGKHHLTNQCSPPQLIN